MKNKISNTYPGFEYEARELSAFIFSFDTFVVSLRNKEIVHYSPASPKDALAFREWLLAHKVREVVV